MTEKTTTDLPRGLVVTDDGSILNWQGVNYVRQDTAEPATAPSVEQIAEVLRERDDWDDHQEIAEAIHALYGTGDADEPEWWTDIESGKKTLHFEGVEWVEASEVQALNLALSAAQSTSDMAIAAVGRWEDKVERQNAALEAADELIEAEHAWGQSKLSAQIAIDERLRREHDVARTSAAYYSARAAVEAETSEEAGHE